MFRDFSGQTECRRQSARRTRAAGRHGLRPGRRRSPVSGNRVRRSAGAGRRVRPARPRSEPGPDGRRAVPRSISRSPLAPATAGGHITVKFAVSGLGDLRCSLDQPDRCRAAVAQQHDHRAGRVPGVPGQQKRARRDLDRGPPAAFHPKIARRSAGSARRRRQDRVRSRRTSAISEAPRTISNEHSTACRLRRGEELRRARSAATCRCSSICSVVNGSAPAPSVIWRANGRLAGAADPRPRQRCRAEAPLHARPAAPRSRSRRGSPRRRRAERRRARSVAAHVRAPERRCGTGKLGRLGGKGIEPRGDPMVERAGRIIPVTRQAVPRGSRSAAPSPDRRCRSDRPRTGLRPPPRRHRGAASGV